MSSDSPKRFLSLSGSRCFSQPSEGRADHDKGGDGDHQVSDRTCDEDPVDPEKARQDEEQDNEDQLLGEGDDHAF